MHSFFLKKKTSITIDDILVDQVVGFKYISGKTATVSDQLEAVSDEPYELLSNDFDDLSESLNALWRS